MHFIISKKLYNRQNSPISPDNSQITFHKHGLFGNSQEVSVITVIFNSVMNQKTPKFGVFLMKDTLQFCKLCCAGFPSKEFSGSQANLKMLLVESKEKVLLHPAGPRCN